MSTWWRILKTIEPHPSEHFKDKAIAVGLAFLLWMAVSAEDIVPEIFTNVPVSLERIPPGLVVADAWDDTLSIRVNGSTRDLRDVSAGQLSPVIDLSDARAGENIFPLLPDDFPVPRGIEITRIEPEQIRVVLENRAEKEVEVSPIVEGEPETGYEVSARIASPERVLISGPWSLLETIDRVRTTHVDVSGWRESFTRNVSLVPPSPFIELPARRTVELTIEISEQAVTQQFDGVPVEVVNSRYRVAVNPRQLNVVLSGPPSALEQIRVENLVLVVDGEGLQPRAADYRLAPELQFEPEELGESLEVIAIYPQREIDVHVYPQPGRQ
jgi:YbbR domain-containing protein